MPKYPTGSALDFAVLGIVPDTPRLQNRYEFRLALLIIGCLAAAGVTRFPHRLDEVGPKLARHGLAWMTFPRRSELDGQPVLRYRLTHAPSGELGEDEIPLMLAAAAPQAGGSAITYARRYAFQAVTGVAPAQGEDDDGAAAEEGPRPVVEQVTRLADEVQKRRIRNRLTEMGITGNDENRMAWVSGVLGAYIESLDQLTRDDAQVVVDRLKPANRQARNR